MSCSEKDTRIVRELARKVAEVAAEPIQEEKRRMWIRHNGLKRVRPMVLVFPEGSWREMTDWQLECEDELCRSYENELKMRLYYVDHLPDDSVIPGHVFCGIVINNTGYGLAGQQTRPEERTGAYHIDPVIKAEADIEKIRIPEVTVDWEATFARMAQVEDLFDGILDVIEAGPGFGWAPMDMFIGWRGIDQMFMDLVDRPEWVHRVMARLLEAKMAEVDQLEAQGALRLNNLNHYTGSGGVGYTDELPQADFDGECVRARDLWASASAQIFSEVSPAMHEEFALQYERRWLSRFGLTNYGCCEPLHNKLEIVKAIPNLRRISISPWADIDKSAASLEDKYVFSWKPNPAIIAARKWDAERVRGVIRDFCERTRGCITDIIMKDTHTCNNEPRRMWDWVRIAKEVAQEFA